MKQYAQVGKLYTYKYSRASNNVDLDLVVKILHSSVWVLCVNSKNANKRTNPLEIPQATFETYWDIL